MQRGLPLCLLFQPSQLVFLPLQLAKPFVMVVHGHTQHLLCVVLADYELVQMLFQHAGRDAADAGARRIGQRAFGRFIGIVEACEALAAEVGAAVL